MHALQMSKHKLIFPHSTLNNVMPYVLDIRPNGQQCLGVSFIITKNLQLLLNYLFQIMGKYFKYLSTIRERILLKFQNC